MCSRMCERPAPTCSSSSTLPVAHQACTLRVTSALRRWQFRPRRRGANRFHWCERFHECLLEIIDVLEVFDRIFFGFPENTGLDEVENHVTNVFGAADAPALENRQHHRAKFLEHVLTHTVEQFRSRHVAYARALDFLLLFRREIKRVPQKYIGLPLITRVSRHNGIERFGESNLLHQWESARIRRASYDNQQARCEQLHAGLNWNIAGGFSFAVAVR